MPSLIKHYPTPTTTTYYIGQFLIDDIFRVDFQRKITDQPIWGYGSRKYDFIARGREIVTGNIIINFRYPGYLRNIISLEKNKTAKINDSIAATGIAGTNTSTTNLNTSNSELISKELLNIISTAISNPNPIQGTNETSALISDAISEAKKLLISRNTPSDDKESLSINAMASPLDKNENLPTFDMTVRYGFQETPGGFVRKFNKINLIGESQIVQVAGGGGLNSMASSAQSLMEVYSFFAQSISVEKYS